MVGAWLMPYSGTSDESLPQNVKDMPMDKRKQWVEVFNSCIARGDDEATAFAKANGVAKKDLEETLVQKVVGAIRAVLTAESENNLSDSDFAYIDSHGGRHLPIHDANHVRNAMSRFNQTHFESAEAKAKAHRKMMAAAARMGIKSLFFTKSTDDGQLRFFTTYSNCFKDYHSEIISTEAHQEYVEWVNKTKQYPQLWLWHAGPKSKWGQVDFIDFVDGFAVASGLVDPDKTHIAKALEKEDVKVSHGFNGLITKDGTFLKYRTFELSPLPAKMAANSWTDFKLGAKETEMPFSDERKKWLKDKANLTDEQITEWEGSLATLGESLKSAGLEWKGKDYDEIIGVTKALTDLSSVVVAMQTKQTEFEATVATFITKMTEFETKVTAATKTLEDKVAEAFLPKNSPEQTGFKASESPKNVVDKEKQADELAWFKDIVADVIK
jgi:hypothetical protein